MTSAWLRSICVLGPAHVNSKDEPVSKQNRVSSKRQHVFQMCIFGKSVGSGEDCTFPGSMHCLACLLFVLSGPSLNLDFGIRIILACGPLSYMWTFHRAGKKDRKQTKGTVVDEAKTSATLESEGKHGLFLSRGVEGLLALAKLSGKVE